MDEKKYYIALDLGGTAIKGGVITKDGIIVVKQSVRTGKERTSGEVIKDMADLCFDLTLNAGLDMSQIEAIGVGAPGMINSKDGVIIYSNNLDWHNVKLSRDLKELTGKNVYITNDANAAALGEAKYGSGKDFNDSVFVTLGTGVGGGIVIGGKLFEGYKSAGAEVGHMVILEKGELCTCGRKGCLEAYASATALIRDTKNAMKFHKKSKMWEICGGDIDKVSGRTSFEAARAGDKVACDVVSSYIEHLAEGIINLVNILRPEAVILGGGICNEGDYLLEPLRAIVELRMYGGNNYAPVVLKIASLGNDAGMMGALAFALQCTA